MLQGELHKQSRMNYIFNKRNYKTIQKMQKSLYFL